jgi:hypothetical protein
MTQARFPYSTRKNKAWIWISYYVGNKALLSHGDTCRNLRFLASDKQGRLVCSQTPQMSSRSRMHGFPHWKEENNA